MQSRERPLLDVVARPIRQYRVPLFQRQFVWDKPQWRELWEDLVALLDNAASPLLDSVVTQQGNAAHKNIQPWLVLHGQQRLTTFLMLLKAMSDHALRLQSGAWRS